VAQRAGEVQAYAGSQVPAGPAVEFDIRPSLSSSALGLSFHRKENMTDATEAVAAQEAELTPLEKFQQEVLAEYPEDPEIAGHIGDPLLIVYLRGRSITTREGLLDVVLEVIPGLESPESKVYVYTRQLKEAAEQIARREELYRRAQQLMRPKMEGMA